MKPIRHVRLTPVKPEIISAIGANGCHPFSAPEEQAHLADYHRERRESEGKLFPDVLIIGTVRNLDSQKTPESLIPELVKEMPNAVELPTLAKRPKEILPLARRFLEDISDSDKGPRRQARRQAWN